MTNRQLTAHESLLALSTSQHISQIMRAAIVRVLDEHAALNAAAREALRVLDLPQVMAACRGLPGDTRQCGAARSGLRAAVSMAKAEGTV